MRSFAGSTWNSRITLRLYSLSHLDGDFICSLSSLGLRLACFMSNALSDYLSYGWGPSVIVWVHSLLKLMLAKFALWLSILVLSSKLSFSRVWFIVIKTRFSPESSYTLLSRLLISYFNISISSLLQFLESKSFKCLESSLLSESSNAHLSLSICTSLIL